MTDDGTNRPELDHSEDATDSDKSVGELKEEVSQLRQAVRSHAVVDQAMGLLVGVGRLTPDEAWDVLREVSMNTNTKLRTVAETLIDWGCSGVLPRDIRQELERRLTHHRRNSSCADAEPPSS